LPPCHRDAWGGRVGTRHLEHAGVEVQAHDVRQVAKSLGGDTGDNPRPTRRIQDPVVGMEGHVRKHQFSQEAAQCVHGLAFIQLRGVPFHLIPDIGHGVLQVPHDGGRLLVL
jgi:hypothetical protein